MADQHETASRRLANVQSVILTICIVVVTVSIVVRPFSPHRGPPVSRRVADWEKYLVGNELRHAQSPTVTIVEFADFPCPHCLDMARFLHQIERQYPSGLRVMYRHVPIDAVHRNARAAANAAECADAAGRFREYHDAVFEAQDTLGRVDWTALATRVGITDAAAFRLCVSEERFAPRIAADERAARELGSSELRRYWLTIGLLLETKPKSRRALRARLQSAAEIRSVLHGCG